MTLDEQINAAIGAHGLWKGKLHAAIDSGASDVSVNVVRDDHQCGFGKWLHGADVDPGLKKSEFYKPCVELHRRFHIAAAEVLALAIAGKKQEASGAMGTGKEFSKVSVELTKTLMACKSAVHARA